VIERAKCLLADWEAVKIASARKNFAHNFNTQQQNKDFKWKKPSPIKMKCNIDASFPNHDNRVGIGMCIRDEEGIFVLAKTEWFEPKCDVHIGEALGLLSALHWVLDFHLGHVDFDLDSKKVVDSFKSNNYDHTEFGSILKDCKSLVSRFYENSSVEFVWRQANEVAHQLAKAATLSTSFQILIEPPFCI